MSRRLIITIFAFILISAVSVNKVSAQLYGVTTNLLGWATGTINVGIEFKLANKWSIEVPMYFNPIVTNNVSLFHGSVQPALKYWFYNVYIGDYIALSNMTSYYQIAMRSDELDKGYLVGGGISYGYAFIISKRWSMNVEGGVGVYYTNYENFKRSVHYTEDKYVYSRSNLLILPARLMCGLTYHF